LACLLVYCNKLVDADDEGYFRNKYNMRHTFRTMSVGQDEMFPVVQLFFERKFRELALSDSRKAMSSLTVDKFAWSEKLKKALSLLMEMIKVRTLLILSQHWGRKTSYISLFYPSIAREKLYISRIMTL